MCGEESSDGNSLADQLGVIRAAFISIKKPGSLAAARGRKREIARERERE